MSSVVGFLRRIRLVSARGSASVASQRAREARGGAPQGRGLVAGSGLPRDAILPGERAPDARLAECTLRLARDQRQHAAGTPSRQASRPRGEVVLSLEGDRRGGQGVGGAGLGPVPDASRPISPVSNTTLEGVAFGPHEEEEEVPARGRGTAPLGRARGGAGGRRR